MPFELHIWGPAFGLPSIDPECLASIAFIDARLGPAHYALVPSSDPFANPFGQLPALHHVQRENSAKSTWVTGYRKIMQYVQANIGSEQEIEEREKADQVAFMEYVQARGRELIDLSLWVSSENYTNTTRSAIGDLLTWPNSWTIPGRLRDEARKRTEHLGLSGLDVDVAAEEQAQRDRASQGLDAQIPNSLKKASNSVSSFLGHGSRGHQFKLAALADNFLDTLDELRGNKRWLLDTGEATPLDYLALGYLTIIRKAEVPHIWLSFALTDRYVKLAKWSEEATREIFSPVKFVNGKVVANPKSRLPWQQPSQRTWMDVGSSAICNFTASLPLIGPAYLHPSVTAPPKIPTSSAVSAKENTVIALKKRQILLGEIVATCLGTVAITGMLFWAGVLRVPSRPPKNPRRDFGAAGAMLGLG